MLRQFVGDGSRFGVAVTYSFEPAVLGTAGALRPLDKFLRTQEAFVVVYGDVLTDLDLTPVLQAHAAAGADVTIVLTRVDDPTRAGIVAFDEQLRVTRIVEKPAAGEVFSEWANAGSRADLRCCATSLLPASDSRATCSPQCCATGATC